MAKDKSTGKTRPVKTHSHKWLTVGKFYHYYTPSRKAPPGTTNHSVKVPAINIKGRWLEKAGFTIGAKVRVQVRVQVRPGRLVLTVEKG